VVAGTCFVYLVCNFLVFRAARPAAVQASHPASQLDPAALEAAMDQAALS
jgi:hypothetical protein